MKKLIITAVLAISTGAFAIDVPNIQSDSDWAIAMTANACKVKLSSLEGARGTIVDYEGGVLYRAYVNGRVVMAASAKSTFIFSKKTCLTPNG